MTYTVMSKVNTVFHLFNQLISQVLTYKKKLKKREQNIAFFTTTFVFTKLFQIVNDL